LQITVRYISKINSCWFALINSYWFALINLHEEEIYFSDYSFVG
jgi:hypothetical protein